MSNYIGGAGYGLALRGASREARPLLDQAASNGDGSYWNLWAAGQIALTNGEYGRALATYQQTYRRYQKPESARLTASLLFALGQTEAAWSAVREIVPNSTSFEPYGAAVVGMRMASYDDDARIGWRQELLQSMPKNNPGREGMTNDYGTAVLFQTTALDRKIESFDNVFEAKTIFLMVRMLNPSAGTAPVVQYAVSLPGSSFLFGYTAYRKGEHEKARENWFKLLASYDERASPPPFGRGSGMFWSAMPYLAISLAKTGKLDEARRLPQRTTLGRTAGKFAGSDPRNDGGTHAGIRKEIDCRNLRGNRR